MPAEQWDCRALCTVDQETLLRDVQATRNCTLPGFDRRLWTGESCRGASWKVYQGGPRHGEPVEEGCPGGWYRTRFAQSFRRYRRREGIQNPKLLSTDVPDLILDALEYYEACEAEARNHYTRATLG